MPKYRYYNSIRWGKSYDEKSGGHIIEAANHEEAYRMANRHDKAEFGYNFLQIEQADGSFRFVTDKRKKD